MMIINIITSFVVTWRWFQTALKITEARGKFSFLNLFSFSSFMNEWVNGCQSLGPKASFKTELIWTPPITSRWKYLTQGEVHLWAVFSEISILIQAIVLFTQQSGAEHIGWTHWKVDLLIIVYLHGMKLFHMTMSAILRVCAGLE